MSAAATAGKPIRSTIPARLDRLSWSPFHTRETPGSVLPGMLDELHRGATYGAGPDAGMRRTHGRI